MKRLFLFSLSIIFLLSGFGKLFDSEAAANTVVMAFGLPYIIAKIVVLIMSNFEIMLGLGILVRKYQSVALKLAAGTLSVFLVYLCYLHFGGIVVSDCGCFGSFFKRSIPTAIYENIVLVGLIALYYGASNVGLTLSKNKKTQKIISSFN